MTTISKRLLCAMMVGTACLTFAACGSATKQSDDGTAIDLNSMELATIEEKAKEEGVVNSVGMPDTWANWKETWADLKEKYGLEHTDTDMASAEELATFENEKKDASADIGDVGIAFGPEAVSRQLALPYKTSYYDEIPDWAKDPEGEGYWLLAYKGTMAFLIDTESTKGKVPVSWEEVSKGDYTLTIGDVSSGNQDQFVLHSAAVANGGDETDIQAGLDYFAELAEEKRLNVQGSDTATLEAGEHQVVPMWDFNALAIQKTLNASSPDRFKVVIPQDGASMSGYTTIINTYTKRPYAAALTREYILSDDGQNNLARGHARPIRDNVELDDDAKAALLPDSEYKNAKVAPIQDADAWNALLPKLGNLWQENVISKMK
ncbi:ABC transporter substrate-binding protein [Streptococcus merionis]|uniref:ABC transporter substrate-binding protein n=1 Tax=Streptococcus merionis TaxID=400065 RepID=UPI0026EE4204|nr:ABC transporter substrate-binding protein [Streptococcus merionis]